MEFNNIIEEIDNLNAIDFNINSLRNVSFLNKTIDKIYGNSLLNNKPDAKVNYEIVKGHLYTTVFEILKNKLKFEDETINKILSLINEMEDIENIYVVDGIVVYKLKKDNKVDTKFVPPEAFIDVTSKEFILGLNLNVYRDFFVSKFNSSSKKYILSSDNGVISYNKDNIKIYTNKPLKKIMQINTDIDGEVAKVIIEENNELYYYDMRVHYDKFDLLQNNYSINNIEELLNSKGKIKKYID